MKTFTQTFGAFAVAVMLTGGSAAWAQEPVPVPEPQQEQEQYEAIRTEAVTGELVTVDPEAMTFTIRTAAEEEKSFRYDDDTEFVGVQDGVSGLATESGMLVTVHFEGEEADATATRVVVDERLHETPRK